MKKLPKGVYQREKNSPKTVAENEKEPSGDNSEITDNKEINGGADGTRTRDLQRDRLAF